MTPATLTALSSELLEIAREHEITGHSGEVMQKAAAILEQVAGADASPFPPLHVGALVTLNQDPYPALGNWFVQLWDGRSDDAKVVARVYGESHEQLRRRADHIAALTAQSGEGVALYEMLGGVLKIERDSSGRIVLEGWHEEAIRAAIAAYEAKRGGVR